MAAGAVAQRAVVRLIMGMKGSPAAVKSGGVARGPTLSADARWVALIVIAALAIRLPLLPLDGPHGDLSAFTFYGSQVLVHGPHALYDPSTIPPAMWVIPPVFPFITGATYWVWRLVVSLAGAAPPAEAGVMVGAPPFGVGGFLVKLWIIAGDFGLAAVAYRWARQWAGPRWGALTAAAILLNPALVYESAWWGQIESLLTLVLALVLVCAAHKRLALAWVCWTVMVLIKPQAVVELPLVLALTLRYGGLPGLAHGAGAAALTFMLVTTPFWLTGRLDKVVGNYANVTSVDHRVSVNAYNLWWAISGPGGWHNWATDTDRFIGFFSYRHAGMAVCLVYAILVLWAYRPQWLWRGQRRFPSTVAVSTVLATGACLYLAFFLMATLIHERYLYPAVVLLAFSLWRHPLFVALYGVFSVTLLINLAHTAPALPWMATGLERLGVTPWRTALVNMVAFAVLTGAVLAWQHNWTLPRGRQAIHRLVALTASLVAAALCAVALGVQAAPPQGAGTRGEAVLFTLGVLGLFGGLLLPFLWRGVPAEPGVEHHHSAGGVDGVHPAAVRPYAEGT